MQTTSKRGLIEIASHEAIVTRRYKDSVDVWTVGIGHTVNAGPPDPRNITDDMPLDRIIDLFGVDVGKFEARVRKAFTRELTQNQFDAAVSFDFNTGGIHKASWVNKFNAGDDVGAKNSFMNWSKPKEIIPRRRKERDLFFSGKYGDGLVNVYSASDSGKVLWSSGKRVDLSQLLDDDFPPSVPQASDNSAVVVLERIGAENRISTTNVAAGVGAASSTIAVGKQAIDVVNEAQDLGATLFALSPWLIVGLVGLGAFLWVRIERNKYKHAAQLALKSGNASVL